MRASTGGGVLAVVLGLAACGSDASESATMPGSTLEVATADAEIGGYIEFSVTLTGDFTVETLLSKTATYSASRTNPTVLGDWELLSITPVDAAAPTGESSAGNETWDIDVPTLDANLTTLEYEFRALCLEQGESVVSSSVDWDLRSDGSDNATQTDEFADFTATCRFRTSGGEVTAGDHATIGGPEGATLIEASTFTAAGYLDDPHVVIAGSSGYGIYKLTDGSSVAEVEGSFYGSLPANGSLISHGSGGFFHQDFDTKTGGFAAFGRLGEFTSNITGGARVDDPAGGVLSVLLADNTDDLVYRLTPATNEFGPTFEQDADPLLNLAAVAGSVVDIYSPPGNGPMLGISDEPGSPGKLFWVNPTDPGNLVVVGDVGEGPRRVACLEPAGTPCVVSSFNAGELAIVDWPNRAAAPTIRANAISVDGPIGIDLALVGGEPTCISTGFNDSTVHFTTIGATDAVDTTVTPTACNSPGHAIFIEDSHYLVTCNASNNFQVTALPQ